jgi:hypothetical protein
VCYYHLGRRKHVAAFDTLDSATGNLSTVKILEDGMLAAALIFAICSFKPHRSIETFEDGMLAEKFIWQHVQWCLDVRSTHWTMECQQRYSVYRHVQSSHIVQPKYLSLGKPNAVNRTNCLNNFHVLWRFGM